MNAERLLALYEKVAEAPDAVPRLRRFVLDLAVRGKLVPQDAGDEPASELLKRIAAEKARLLKAGEIKKPKPSEPVDEPPFSIPLNWTWTRLGVVASYIQRGKSPKYAPTDGSPVISQKCVQWAGLDLGAAKLVTLESLAKYEPIRFLRDGDLLWNSTGTGTIGRIIRLSDPPDQLVCDSHVTVVRCLEVDPEYARTWLRTDHVYGVIEDRAAGSTNQVELTAQMANTQPLPLPPLAEQRRIVVKVEELMALLDRLEAARGQREATRDRLTAASLVRLTFSDSGPDADPADFPNNARFALSTLPALTSRPDQIKPLRQTILNLAVRGKLVEQDATDEPVSSLVAMIRSERNEKKKRSLEPDMSLVDFSIPSHWTWQSLDEILTDGPQNGLSPRKSERRDAPKAITLTATTSGIFDAQQFKHVDVSMADAARYWLEPGDLLFQRGNTREYVGMAAIYDGPIEEFIFPDLIMRVRISPQMDTSFVHLWCVAPFARYYLSSNATGAQKTMPKINQGILRSLPVPVPPLAEQHRIVAKFDALMALCDRLEAALTTADSTRARLLEALLHEALEPAQNAQEAAE